MVRCKVNLAQVVSAVYALNKPTGASKREIVKFCKKRFGDTCSSKEIGRLIEKGVDEELLTCFHKRYRVTKLRFGILWARNVSEAGRKKKAAGKRKQRGGIKKGFERKQKPKRKINIFLKRRVKPVEDSLKKTSLYELWKKELELQVVIMRKSLCKPRKTGREKSKTLLKKQKRQSLKQVTKRNPNNKKEKVIRSQRLKIQKSKIQKLKQKNTKKQRIVASLKKGNIKKKSRQNNSRNSRASSHNGESEQNSEFYRTLMRQTKQAVTHGKSWDKLNYARQKRIRENQELMKKSKLINKILTEAHAESWDDLNAKLKDMKTTGCHPQEAKADGDGEFFHSLTSLYPV